MTKTLSEYERFERSNPANRRRLRLEELNLDITCAMYEVMETTGVSKRVLAHRIGITPDVLTQYLNHERKLTMAVIADIADALGCRPQFKLEPK